MTSGLIDVVPRLEAMHAAISRMTIKRSTNCRLNSLRVIQFQKFYNEELEKRGLHSFRLDLYGLIKIHKMFYQDEHYEGLF